MTGRFSKIALAIAGMTTAMLPLAAEAQARPHWGRGGGWGGDWGGRHWHRDRGGVDGGDVLAGLLIIGGIAAIATAASNAEKKRDGRNDDDYNYRPDRNDDWRGNGSDNGDSDNRDSDWNSGASRGIDDAVNRCVEEASRRGEVDEVYDAARSGEGYRVSGTLKGGDDFDCQVRGNGTVDVDVRDRNF